MSKKSRNVENAITIFAIVVLSFTVIILGFNIVSIFNNSDTENNLSLDSILP